VSDMEELHQRVMAALKTPRIDEAQAVGRDSLLAAFNRVADEAYRIDRPGDTSLTVKAGSGRRGATAHDTAFLIEHFSRAVASIGQEIRRPDRDYVPLRRPDYVKAPIFITTSPSGFVLIQPERPEAVFATAHPNISELALGRLAGLLPNSPEDDQAVGNSVGARVASRRALREIAAVSMRMDGLELTLTRRGLESKSFVTKDQADEIEELLSMDETEVTTLRLTGMLDGARESKRLFFLEPDTGKPISGVIDERLVDAVFGTLRQRVAVKIERSQTRTRAGAVGRPGFRLVDVQQIEELPE